MIPIVIASCLKKSPIFLEKSRRDASSTFSPDPLTKIRGRFFCGRFPPFFFFYPKCSRFHSVPQREWNPGGEKLIPAAKQSAFWAMLKNRFLLLRAKCVQLLSTLPL